MSTISQIPLRDPMWSKQGTGPGQVDLGQMTRQWVDKLEQAIASGAGGTTSQSVFPFSLQAGANPLTAATFGLPTNFEGTVYVILTQPGDSTITWSADFSGVIANIDPAASTISVFAFVGTGTKWVMTSFTTGMLP